ncbi:UNVERIFIED_CONTAM: hypothetical protein Slati_3495100 [Sesamum latifolium]|uniref:Uncharacterized protein n=1 Tax=Sesamum latifolium TaxID=2727402 RepID=A0AAW2UIY6_9LAMI
MGWKEKFLSTAVKEILMKPVLQSIPMYMMQCFLIPDSLVREIQSFFVELLWSSPKNRRIHWIAWSRFCTSKHARWWSWLRGPSQNLALLAKQAWRSLTQPVAYCQRWQLGDGRNTCAWTDGWLTRPFYFRPISLNSLDYDEPKGIWGNMNKLLFEGIQQSLAATSLFTKAFLEMYAASKLR